LGTIAGDQRLSIGRGSERHTGHATNASKVSGCRLAAARLGAGLAIHDDAPAERGAGGTSC